MARRIFKRKQKMIYGVYGIGGTCFSLALANFCGSVLKEKVAFLEMGDDGISDLTTRDTVLSGPMVGFKRGSVDIFPAVSSDEAKEIGLLSYDVIVCDFTTDLEMSHDYFQVFKECTRRIFLASLAPYRRRKYSKTYNFFNTNMVEVEVLVFVLNSAMKVWHMANYSKEVKEAPYIPNPDKLSKDNMFFFRKFLAA